MWINWNAFDLQVLNQRMLWVGGRFGGFKTSFCMELSKSFMERGYRLISNTRCVWNEDMDKLDFVDKEGHLKVVVILDEGGTYLVSNRQIMGMLKNCAKMDIILLIPSRFKPPTVCRELTVKPLWSFFAIGLPVVTYRYWIDDGGDRERGFFGWIYPQSVFGVYSRQDPGSTAEDIIEWLVRKTGDYAELYGHKRNGIFEVEESTAQDRLTDSSETMAEAAGRFETVSVRKHKRF